MSLRPGDSVTGNTTAIFSTLAQQAAVALGGFSIANYLPDGVAIFNINGVSRPLSRYYGTLAAAQSVYPHATSLSNETAWAALQATINAAYAAGGGRAFVPPGQFWLGNKQLTPSVIPAGDDGNNSVRLIGAGSRMCQLYWNEDTGALATYGIAQATRTDFSRFVVQGFTLRGPATTLVLGSPPCNLSGVAMSAGWIIEDCFVENFYAGLDIQGDHVQVLNCAIGRGCYYGAYYSAGSITFGDHLFLKSTFGGASLACVGIAPGNGINNNIFLDCDMGFTPYAFYVEAGHTGSVISNTIFTKTQAESVGNAWFYSPNSGDYIINSFLQNVGIIFNPTYAIAGHDQVYCKTGHFVGNVIQGPHVSVPNYSDLTGPAFDVANDFANNTFNRPMTFFTDATSAHPLTNAGTCYQNGFFESGFTGTGCTTMNSVTGGDVVAWNGAGLTGKAMTASAAPAGVAQASYNTGQCALFCDRGVAVANKVTGAISAGDILVTDESSYGKAIKGSSSSTKSIIGVATAGALSGDATVSINVDIHRYLARS